MSDQPQLSESALSYYRGRLADTAFERDHPQMYNVLKSTVDEALARTGQQLYTPPPVPSPQEWHDRQFGVVERAATDYTVPPDSPIKAADLAALKLPPQLGRVIAQDLVENSAMPVAERERQLAIFKDREQMTSDVDALLQRAGIALKAKDLPPLSLTQLRVWAQHVSRHAATRPTK